MGYNVYSQSPYLTDYFSFNLGDMGIGYNNSTDNEIRNFEFNLSLANLFFQYPDIGGGLGKSRVGIKMSPFNFRVLFDDNFNFSFFNIDIFTNFLPFPDDDRLWYFNLGPFSSINWLLFEEKQIKPESYIFNTGLRFSLLAPGSIFYRGNVIDFDIGYRRIKNTNNIYFTIKFDFVFLFNLFLPLVIRNSA